MSFYAIKQANLKLRILAFLVFPISIIITFMVIQNSFLLDFDIYYNAGKAVLSGDTPYQLYGHFNLPFQYFPWIAWLFIPFSLFPEKTGWILFAYLNIVLLFISIRILYNIHNKDLSQNEPFYIIFFFSTSLLMSLLMFMVGQVSILMLFSCTLAINFIHKKKYALAGWMVPLILVKPHLVLFFLPALFLISKKEFVITAFLSTGCLLAIATILYPSWPNEMINVFIDGQARGDRMLWAYSTLPGALRLKNWRVLNFYFAIPSFFIALFLLQKQINLPIFPRLSFLLAYSLFSAPYSFAYDFPLLIPSLIFLSKEWNISTALIWTICATYPALVGFQGQTYFLILFVILLIETKTIDTKY